MTSPDMPRRRPLAERPPFDLTRMTRRDILEHMFEYFSPPHPSDRDMAQDLLVKLIPRQRQPSDDQPPKFPGGGPWGYWPKPGEADLK
jgi:hypothetical protein